LPKALTSSGVSDPSHGRWRAHARAYAAQNGLATDPEPIQGVTEVVLMHDFGAVTVAPHLVRLLNFAAIARKRPMLTPVTNNQVIRVLAHSIVAAATAL
jgi:hypothetical protein